MRLTVETCPHYLTLTAEEVAPAPPRSSAARRSARPRIATRSGGALESGTIDFVVSDHSPAPAELKLAGDGDFADAWGGIASLQLGLPLVWTEARRRGIPLARVVEWMSAAPARRVGLADKGAIAEGHAADLAVVAPDATFTVDAAALEHRHPITPYDGRELVGVVRATYLAGTPIDRSIPRGRLLRRAESEDGTGRCGLTTFNEADRDDGDRGAPAVPRHPALVRGARRRAGRMRRSTSSSRAPSAAASPFTADEVDGALAHHPRIGERAAGEPREAADVARGAGRRRPGMTPR